MCRLCHEGSDFLVESASSKLVKLCCHALSTHILLPETRLLEGI